MKKIEENRSLFYNLLDFARMSGGDKGESVEDMFGGPDTELDAICQEYLKKNKNGEWKVNGEIRIPSRSSFGKHRKQIREDPKKLSGKIAGNYEHILNALLWKNNYLKIINSKTDSLRVTNTEILRTHLRDEFSISRGFNGRDEELIFNLCEEKLEPYIQKISHIALFPHEMDLIRKLSEGEEDPAPSLEDDIDKGQVITVLLSIEDSDRSLRLRDNMKKLESAFLQAVIEKKLKLPVISCIAKGKKEVDIVKSVINSSSYVLIIADNTRNAEMDSLIKYVSDHSEDFGFKPLLCVNTTEKSKAELSLFSESSLSRFQMHEYSKDSEILFEIARLFLSFEIMGKPKAEIRSEVFYLNGISAVDLLDHPMFSTDTLLKLRQKYAQLNERYDCLIIGNKSNANSLAELDSERSMVATKIRQYENLICDCQMTAIGIEQTGSVLDNLNVEAESLVNSGKYKEAILLLNKREWEEECNSALANKAKAEEDLRAYIKSRQYLIASMRILDETKQTESKQTELIAIIYEKLRKVAEGTGEYGRIVYEYLAFLIDIGRYEDAEKLVLEEESNCKKLRRETRNYRFLYLAGEMYYKTGKSTLAEAYFKKADIYVPINNRLDYIELNVGIAKCMWKAKRYTLMRHILKNIEDFVSRDDMHSPRGKRILSAMYRFLAIYESNCFHLPKALKLAEKALEIYTPLYEIKQGDPIQEIEDKMGYAVIMNNIAVLHRRMDNDDKSADLARTVLDIYRMCARSNPAVSLIEITKACRNYSLTLRKQGKYDLAENVMKEAMSILEEFRYTTEKEKRQKINCFSEMGNIKLGLKRYSEAEEYFQQASLWVDKIKSGDNFMYDVYCAENNYDLGRLYRHMNEYEKSEKHLLQAVELWSKYSRDSTGKYTVLLAQAYGELALTVEKNGKKSDEYRRKSEELIEQFSPSAKKHARKKFEASLRS